MVGKELKLVHGIPTHGHIENETVCEREATCCCHCESRVVVGVRLLVDVNGGLVGARREAVQVVCEEGGVCGGRDQVVASMLHTGLVGHMIIT